MSVDTINIYKGEEPSDCQIWKTLLSFSRSIDTYAMAGMALKCVNDSGTHVDNANELASALNTVKQELWKSRRTDGHIGNEFSTGLAVQVSTQLSLFHSMKPSRTNSA